MINLNQIIIRPLLNSGMFAMNENGNATILIDSEQPIEELRLAVYHEMIHYILFAYGIEDQDEEKVEKIAQALAGKEIVTE